MSGVAPAGWRRAAADLVGAAGSVTGVDRNDGMLAVARRTEGVTWVDGDAHDLPFEDASFDRVTCAFVLMFLDDPALAVREMARVLRPGGRLVLATWADVAESPGYADLVGVLRTVAGEDAAQALLAPFRLGTSAAVLEAVGTAVPRPGGATARGACPVPLAGGLDAHRDPRLDPRRGDRRRDVRAAGRRGPAAPWRRHVGDDGTVSFAAPALLAVATT